MSQYSIRKARKALELAAGVRDAQARQLADDYVSGRTVLKDQERRYRAARYAVEDAWLALESEKEKTSAAALAAWDALAGQRAELRSTADYR